MVNYPTLKANSKNLDDYLEACAAVSETEYARWSESSVYLAFCINLYNASTVWFVLDHYPLKSIKKIGGWFSVPWEQPAVTMFGRATTPAHLEH